MKKTEGPALGVVAEKRAGPNEKPLTPPFYADPTALAVEDPTEADRSEAMFATLLEAAQKVEDIDPGDGAVVFLPSGENVLLCVFAEGLRVKRDATMDDVVSFLERTDGTA